MTKWAVFAILIVIVVAAVVVTLFVNKGHRVIKIKSFLGEVTLERDSSEKKIVKGMNLKSRDTVTTGTDGLAELLVDEDKHIVAEAETSFTIVASGNEKQGKLKIKLLYGTSLVEIDNKLKNGSSVEVETSNATLSVKGTTFKTTYDRNENKTIVEVTEGTVSVEANGKTADVEAGNTAIITDNVIEIELSGDENGESEDNGNEKVIFEQGEEKVLVLPYHYTSNGMEVYMRYTVKCLVGWKKSEDTSEVNTIERDGVKIKYALYSEDEVNDIVNGQENETGYSDITYEKNEDGDTVMCVICQNEDTKVYSVQFFKESYIGIGENKAYVSVMVYDKNNGENIESMGGNKNFISLTNDEFWN